MYEKKHAENVHQKLIPGRFLILLNNPKEPLHARILFANQIFWKKALKKKTLFSFRTACIRMSLNVIRMSCHSYVTRMYSYVTRMSLVCGFTINPHWDSWAVLWRSMIGLTLIDILWSDFELWIHTWIFVLLVNCKVDYGNISAVHKQVWARKKL